MSQVQITFQDDNAAGKALKIVTFVGQLDETNVDSEAQKIYQVIEEMAEPNLLLDFADLEYMNSKSIGYVTDWYSKAMAKGGKIVIARPRANILDILKVVGITQIVTVFENLEEAKASFAGTVAPVAPAQEPVTAAVPAQTPAPEAPASAAPETPTVPEVPTEPPAPTA